MIVKISESIINEALKPSEFRDLMKVGRELAMERINQIWPRLEAMADAKNRSGDRLYFNIEQSNDLEIPSKNEIVNFLSDNNYDVVNFSKGFVKKRDDKNIVKLGKVLKMFGKSDKTALDLLQKYNNEKSVVVNNGTEYLMVISKHPYDIGGMATDRSWKSCMNLRGGENKDYVQIDIRQGTIISYLIEKNDKNIQTPVSRILIKPYINEDDQNDILYGVEQDSVKYGRDNEKYVKKLIFVLDKAQEEKTGIFEIDRYLYSDGETTIKKLNIKKIKEVENKIGNQIKELRDRLTFEIIVEKFPWLYEEDVVFKDAILGIEDERLKWYDGVWINGIWKDGIWGKGTWQKGTWQRGTWKNGIWEGGNWKGGFWEKGIWENGTWEKGVWYDGIWKNGIWEKGRCYNCNWENGTWVSGDWHGGIWKGGVWKDGNWLDGNWINGYWYNGYWYNGTWKGGVWETGKIWNQEEREYIESNTPPK